MRVRFAQYLVSRGYLDSDQAHSLAEQIGSFRELIGAIAMSHHLIDMGQLDHILSQLSGDRRFGETAIELGYLNQQQIEALLRIQEIQEAMEFGECLIVQGLMARGPLLEELSRFFLQVDGAVDSPRLAQRGELDPAPS